MKRGIAIDPPEPIAPSANIATGCDTFADDAAAAAIVWGLCKASVGFDGTTLKPMRCGCSLAVIAVKPEFVVNWVRFN